MRGMDARQSAVDPICSVPEPYGTVLGATDASTDPEVVAPRNPGPWSFRLSRPHDLGEAPWVGRETLECECRELPRFGDADHDECQRPRRKVWGMKL